jgi:hypothetical protein
VHVPLVAPHLEEAPYIGFLFLGLIAVCGVLAVTIVLRDTALTWVASGAASLLALLAFLLSRTVGLPQIGDDIGNWTEPRGYPALLAEVGTVLLAAVALRKRARTRAAGPRTGASVHTGPNVR